MEEKNSEKKERKMRDSGIPWIGEVPEGWKIKKIKYLIKQTKDGIKIGPFGSALSNKTLDNGDYNVYGQANLVNSDFTTTKNTINQNTFNNLSSYEVIPGDICVSMMGTIGKCKVVPHNIHRGIMDSHLIKIRLNDNEMISEFFEYVYDKDNSPVCFTQMQYEKTGSIMDGLNTSIVKRIYLPTPPISEQHRIAAFLDSKCSEIDTLIENLRARMESVKEYKKAVITEAVTKGLNKDAKMKDSGVEWIGKIPEGWKIVQFKHIASIKSNLVQPDKYMKYPQIAPDNIEKDTGRLLSHQTVEESGIISGNHLFYRGQILYSKIRPNLNKLTVAPFDGLCSADMYPIESKLPTPFMVYSMLSTYFVSQVSLIIQDRVKMPKINQEELGEIKVVVPSQQEMLTIADYLDSKCSEIDALLQNYEDQITTLEEYKKSLIYEYVTGKKEVPAT
ncbi:restriction endonuclease subunit S [bacterium 210702-DFI.5.13]|nr:restriction endonuclease subunit S [bacterium 210702-DFI.5.13]